MANGLSIVGLFVGAVAFSALGWFLALMEELAITCHVGHPATIRHNEPRRQKHDRRDARLLLDLLRQERFPSIWMPSVEQRDIRALLLHRDQWVRMRTQVMNALQGIALAHGLRRGTQLRSRSGQAALAAVPLQPHAARKLGIRLWILLRDQIDYAEFCRRAIPATAR